MSTMFRYEARAQSGQTQRGVLHAETHAEALARLRGRRLTPLVLKIDRTGNAAPRLSDRAARDLARTLAQLLKSGLSFSQALSFAGEELSAEASAAAQHLREAAERGDPPSRALQSFHGAQARLLTGVILAGETSGRLADALELAATGFARAAEMRSRLATALIYPSFVLLATIATLASFMLLVVPTLGAAFEGSEAALPQSTHRLLAMSAWIQANGLWLFLATVGIGCVIWTSHAIRQVMASTLDAWLTSPLGFGILPRLEFSTFAGLASLSLESGVPSAAAFETAVAGLRSEHIRVGLLRAVAAIRSGKRPSAAIREISRAPRALVRLMQVGEETGAPATALRYAAELLNAEAEQRIQRAGAIAGPVATLLLGGLVASVVVSLFLGLLAMSDMAGA